MDIFDLLSLIGGLCLFLFGMNIMGEGLEKRAGKGLKNLLSKLTTKKSAGFLTGLGVTSVIQSSSATTVMVVGFVNSGIMSLGQAINVIMGANVGTTVTSWILSLSGIESSNYFIKFLKPSSFTPILALIGIVLYLFLGNKKRRDTGIILLGFSILMTGMQIMSDSVKGLAEVEGFKQLFILFKNPLLGLLAGSLLTAIVQSSSASLGILQALSVTGAVSVGSSLPIIMGQNIGTCVTAIISSVGTNKNAKRAGIVHLLFNVIGSSILLFIFWIINITLSPSVFDTKATHFSIAVCHTIFNVFSTAILLPASGILERLACKIIPDVKLNENQFVELDERLFATPTLAIEQCKAVTEEMANTASSALKKGISLLYDYKEIYVQDILECENKTDRYEDIIGNYLVKLSGEQMSASDHAQAAMLLRIIGDFERICDHAVNISQTAAELNEKNLKLSERAAHELNILTTAVNEIIQLTTSSFSQNSISIAKSVEPLEQVIDLIKEELKIRHIERLQNGNCTIEIGFIWSDLLNDLERTADHCSNIAGCIIDMEHSQLTLHKFLGEVRKNDPYFRKKYKQYKQKYSL
ncbi:MAG: Na/Pi cotransporter family protein [Ruminococcaceae bacterium]|nr:Na/Pi cotransporter family protein [Oscillospiraceae bacterium]